MDPTPANKGADGKPYHHLSCSSLAILPRRWQVSAEDCGPWWELGAQLGARTQAAECSLMWQTHPGHQVTGTAQGDVHYLLWLCGSAIWPSSSSWKNCQWGLLLEHAEESEMRHQQQAARVKEHWTNLTSGWCWSSPQEGGAGDSGLQELGAPHPLYLPDLSPSDFSTFTDQIREQHFSSK